MLKVGLTGGIASGKTTVARMFRDRGAHIIAADEIAHQLMSPGESVYNAVVAAFGREILDADGTIARPKLAALAFPDRVKELNALVHPAVVDFQDRWMQQVAADDPKGIAVVEAALIFEAGAESHFDRMITVISEVDEKAARFAERQNVSSEVARAEVERRMAAQKSDIEKARASDFVIDNSGSVADLERQVKSVWRELVAAAAVSG